MPAAAYLILVGYVVLAFSVLMLTWNNWWRDHRIARPLHMVDLVLFGALVFFTEGYTSPFFTFSVFLLLSSSIRWEWEETAKTAVAVNGIFLIAGLLSAYSITSEVDAQRLIIRASYLLVLSALFVLYAHRSQAEAYKISAHSKLGEAPELPQLMELAIKEVKQHTKARKVIVAWHDEDEPRSYVLASEGAKIERRELSLCEITAILLASPENPFLFDTESRHLLMGNAFSWHSGEAGPALFDFLEDEKIPTGLAVPLRSACLECIIFASDIPDLSLDHLTGSARLAEEICRSSEQILFNRLWEETTGTRIRLSIARDLHDSVSQLLSGISFRLEALKRSGNSEVGFSNELGVLQEELTLEQHQITKLITQLRRPTGATVAVDISERIPALVDRLGRQWRLTCIYAGEKPVQAAAYLEQELHQMIREAVANAARHGGATKVTIEVIASKPMLEIRFTNNGSDFPQTEEGIVRPRSLCERVEGLGGSLGLSQDDDGSTVRIIIPDKLAG